MVCWCTAAAAVLFILVALKIYIKLVTGWCKSERCLLGKTAIVTGSNTGIGFYTALNFATRGARVILACRDVKKAEAAREKIVQLTDNENVTVMFIDLASFKSVREFAKKIIDKEERLDILVNNAGAGGLNGQRTEDNHDLLMQINYFSPFLLTNLLAGLLKRTSNSRIVNVSSIMAKRAKNFDVNKLDKFPGKESFLTKILNYNKSKLCNILFTIESAKRLQGTGVTTYSLHPGAVNTEIFRTAEGLWKPIFAFIGNYFFKTCEEGAQTTIHCSIAKGLEIYNGEHFENCKKVETYQTARDPGLPKKVWEATLDIIQMKPEEALI